MVKFEIFVEIIWFSLIFTWWASSPWTRRNQPKKKFVKEQEQEKKHLCQEFSQYFTWLSPFVSASIIISKKQMHYIKKIIIIILHPFTSSSPKFIGPEFAKTSPKRSFYFSMTEKERFGPVFAKTGSINSGTGSQYKTDANVNRLLWAIIRSAPPPHPPLHASASFIFNTMPVLYFQILQLGHRTTHRPFSVYMHVLTPADSLPQRTYNYCIVC
jgi:hypothetical protein